MTTAANTPRKAAPKLSLRDQLSHEHSMAVRKSVGTFDALSKEDGKETRRLIHLGDEYADMFLASRK